MKQVHLIPKTYQIILTIILPLIVLCLTLLTYTFYKNYEYNTHSIEEAVSSTVLSINRDISSIESTIDIGLYSSDFLFFSNSSRPSKITYYSTRFANSLLPFFNRSDIVRCLAFYNTQNDRLYLYNEDARSYITDVRDQLHTFLSGESSAGGVSRVKEHSVLTLNDRSYLCYVIKQRYGVVAVLYDLERSDIFQSFRKIYPTQFSIHYEEPRFASRNILKIEDVSESLPFSVSYDAPSLLQLTGFNPFQYFVSVMILVLLVVTVFAFIHLRRLLFEPLLYLSESFNIVSAGDMKYRITQSSKIIEISKFYRGFNDMLNTIEHTKNQTYQLQMAAVQAKLQYLQLQIRPHFYLNCLKNINSLAQLKEYDKIQSLVLYLSDYFRYNFQDVRNYVPIREELNAIQSYVNLCKILYTDIDLGFDIESEVLEFQCLPLSMLTFVENALKHGKNLEYLKIRIRLSMAVRDDGDMDILCKISNTGYFDDDALVRLNTVHTDSDIVYRKERVGVLNVRYRLWLTYGANYTLRFYNQDDFAVVKLRFPAETYHNPADPAISN